MKGEQAAAALAYHWDVASRVTLLVGRSEEWLPISNRYPRLRRDKPTHVATGGPGRRVVLGRPKVKRSPRTRRARRGNRDDARRRPALPDLRSGCLDALFDERPNVEESELAVTPEHRGGAR
jgi:hypothetical protein